LDITKGIKTVEKLLSQSQDVLFLETLPLLQKSRLVKVIVVVVAAAAAAFAYKWLR